MYSVHIWLINISQQPEDINVDIPVMRRGRYLFGLSLRPYVGFPCVKEIWWRLHFSPIFVKHCYGLVVLFQTEFEIQFRDDSQFVFSTAAAIAT